ncbi:type I-E CRISPR-associated protein Cas6/Cse3/CasE [Actinomycetaceae bacterium L2_0104]
MYLARCELNPNRRGAKKLLGSPQAMHAAILSCFPRSKEADAGRILWRVDHTDAGVFVYIVAKIAPDWTGLEEQGGWPNSSTGDVRNYQPFLDSLEAGKRYSFRLTANPTHSVRTKAGGDTKRLGHVTVGHQEDWLLKKARANGFEIPTFTTSDDPEVEPESAFQVTRRQVLSFWRADDKGKRGRVTLTQAEYEGVLVVTDHDRLVKALISGIGPAKGYGCGLLTLAAPPTGQVRVL